MRGPAPLSVTVGSLKARGHLIKTCHNLLAASEPKIVPCVVTANLSNSNSQNQSCAVKLTHDQQAPPSNEPKLHNFLIYILLVQTYLSSLDKGGLVIKGALWWFFKNVCMWITRCTFVRLHCSSTAGVLQCKGHLRVWRLVITVPLVSGPLEAYRATE